MKSIDMFVYGLLLIGGLTCGLYGLFDFNPVEAIFGEASFITMFIYALIGLAAVYDIVTVKAIWKRWNVHYKEPVHA